MLSMISFVTNSRPTGNRDATTRKASPRETTVGPDCQTIFNTGGRLRSAATRSFQPLQKLSRSTMFIFHRRSGSRLNIQRGPAVENSAKQLEITYLEQKLLAP